MNFTILEVLDRFSRCNSTTKYTGRRIARRGDSKSSNRQRVSAKSCDVFSGRWVYDNASYPLYKESDCPYMSDQLACNKHGRTDLGYQHWRWQPHDCNLKRCFLFLALFRLSFCCWHNDVFGLSYLNLYSDINTC